MSTPSVVALVVVGLLVVLAVALYNGVVRARIRVKTAWAQIDTQLKRRTDLVPNLIASVRGYFEHEAGVIEQVATTREGAVRAGDDPARRAGAEAALGGALGTLVARVEAMPALKGNETVLALMEELSTTENRIAFARSHYNDAVGTYNATIQTVPTILIARPAGFTAERFFELDAPATVPSVDLSREPRVS